MSTFARFRTSSASVPRLLARYYRSFTSEAGPSSSSSSSSSTSKVRAPSTASSESSLAKQNKPNAEQPLQSKEDLEGAKRAEDAAKFATAFMFPWEKRALDGSSTGLSNIEKGYWVVFAGAMLYFGLKVFNNKSKQKEEDGEESDEAKRLETLKKQRALSILQGESIIGGEEDPFEGLTPDEIDAYVKSNTKHSLTPALFQHLPTLEEEDEFEGMTPDEINDYMAKKQAASSQ